MSRPPRYSGTALPEDWAKTRPIMEEFMRDVRNALSGKISFFDNISAKRFVVERVTSGEMPIFISWGPVAPMAVFVTMAREAPSGSGAIVYLSTYPDWRYQGGQIQVNGISGLSTTPLDVTFLILG